MRDLPFQEYLPGLHRWNAPGARNFPTTADEVLAHSRASPPSPPRRRLTASGLPGVPRGSGTKGVGA